MNQHQIQTDRYRAARARLNGAGEEFAATQEEIKKRDEAAKTIRLAQELAAELKRTAELNAQIEEYRRDESRVMPHKAILREVAAKHNLRVFDLKSVRRRRDLVKARHEAAYRIHKETTFSLPQIGRILGDRDHTTILHAVRAHQKRIDSGEAEQWVPPAHVLDEDDAQ